MKVYINLFFFYFKLRFTLYISNSTHFSETETDTNLSIKTLSKYFLHNYFAVFLKLILHLDKFSYTLMYTRINQPNNNRHNLKSFTMLGFFHMLPKWIMKYNISMNPMHRMNFYCFFMGYSCPITWVDVKKSFS